MNAIDFLSKTNYLILPSKSKPKVYLAITTSSVSTLSFKLYNPFSKSGKILKVVIRFLCVYLNPIAKLILPTFSGGNSEFINFLNDMLNESITSSLYLSTDKNKVVLQLQKENDIIGYLKFPVSSAGEMRLDNEILAIKLLIAQHILPLPKPTIGKYKNIPFLLLPDLKGEIGKPRKLQVLNTLNLLKKDRAFKLSKHPRIASLRNSLLDCDLVDLCHKLDEEVSSSKKNYQEVLEHGDFAPWNLIDTGKGVVPFDFEFFNEKGLQYLDEIKYHYQIQRLLNHRKGVILIDSVRKELNIEEFTVIFKVFLISEILNKHRANEQYEFETSLISLIE